MSEYKSFVSNEDLDLDRLTQEAMWGYVDEAQKDGHAHDRLVRASRQAALAVVAVLRETGHLRPLVIERVAVHGTSAGYSAGCRCEYCREAVAVYQRANYYYNRTKGHNKVRDEDAA